MKRRWKFVGAVVSLLAVAACLLSALHAAKSRAQSINCHNRMVSICMAARLWAGDHDGILPPDFLTISNELCSPVILHCRGDISRTRATNWAEYSTANCSYEMVSPSGKDGDKDLVLMRCKVHGHIGYADGSVFDGVRRQWKIF